MDSLLRRIGFFQARAGADTHLLSFQQLMADSLHHMPLLCNRVVPNLAPPPADRSCMLDSLIRSRGHLQEYRSAHFHHEFLAPHFSKERPNHVVEQLDQCYLQHGESHVGEPFFSGDRAVFFFETQEFASQSLRRMFEQTLAEAAQRLPGVRNYALSHPDLEVSKSKWSYVLELEALDWKAFPTQLTQPARWSEPALGLGLDRIASLITAPRHGYYKTDRSVIAWTPAAVAAAAH